MEVMLCSSLITEYLYRICLCYLMLSRFMFLLSTTRTLLWGHFGLCPVLLHKKNDAIYCNLVCFRYVNIFFCKRNGLLVDLRQQTEGMFCSCPMTGYFNRIYPWYFIRNIFFNSLLLGKIFGVKIGFKVIPKTWHSKKFLIPLEIYFSFW